MTVWSVLCNYVVRYSVFSLPLFHQCIHPFPLYYGWCCGQRRVNFILRSLSLPARCRTTSPAQGRQSLTSPHKSHNPPLHRTPSPGHHPLPDALQVGSRQIQLQRRLSSSSLVVQGETRYAQRSPTRLTSCPCRMTVARPARSSVC